MSIGLSTAGTTLPNIQDSKARRYPNQFFDLSQQYMPPTIKELFRWCTFYYYNSPLIGSAIKKVSRYPITDIIIEDPLQKNRELWDHILNRCIKIKDRLLEVNLDKGVYGNCFVSLHLPITRILKCQKCNYAAPIKQWTWSFSGYKFRGKCKSCEENGELTVSDVPYKDAKKIRLVRWNPENIEIKYNEYTGNTVYLYTPPARLRMAIENGDKDFIEDTPLIVLESIKEKKKIRMNPDNIFHLKNPTLAEQDQGWGKPIIIHVLKDMFYFYTLRRAQEAIAMQHILPLDVIYPMPNAQMDPYVHSDLGSWRSQIEKILDNHRRDPNFKAIIPIPIGFGRIGGDGKALMLAPEQQYLTQTIVGGMGLPQEFLFGGLNWTGSSVSLRTLENDFIQDRSQLLDLVLWIKDKVRIWINCPDVESVRFADFRMADDIQRNQQLIGLNAQGKISDQTMLTELGYKYEEETQRRLEEAYVQAFMNDILTKGQARSQGEAQLIQFNFQQKVQDLAAKAQEEAHSKFENSVKHDTAGVIQGLTQKLLQMDPARAESALITLKETSPEIAVSVESAYRSYLSAQQVAIEQQQAQQQLLSEQEAQQQSELEQQHASTLIQEQAKADVAQQRGAQSGGQQAQQQPKSQAESEAKAQGKARESAQKQPQVVINMNQQPEQKPPRRKGGT